MSPWEDEDWAEMTPSEAALASVWPLVDGEVVPLHEDACALFVGQEACDCERIMLRGPTGFA